MINLTAYKLISFDGDATLWDFEKVMHDGLQKILAELQTIVGETQPIRLTVEDMIDIRNQIASKSSASHEDIRRASFAAVVKQLNIDDEHLVDHLNQTYFDYRFSTIALYDDTLPALAKLRKEHKIALATNGNNYPNRFGISNYFDFELFSDQCGYRKPDQRFFEILGERTGCLLSEILHVGDSITSDVGGAINAGMTAIWLNRNQLTNETNIEPDFEVQTLTQLLNLSP